MPVKEVYTAFCAYSDTPRGVYEEEIDVEAISPGNAIKQATAILKAGYAKGLYVRKVVHRGPGLFL